MEKTIRERVLKHHYNCHTAKTLKVNFLFTENITVVFHYLDLETNMTWTKYRQVS